MKKKIVGVLVCTLLIIVTSGTVAQTIEMNKQEKVSPNEIIRTDKVCEIPVSSQFWEECNPSIDVEKYVRDKNGLWVDADTEDEAVDLRPCIDALFKIVIHNDGDCPFLNITVWDTMSDGLTFITADPAPDNFSYEPPYYYTYWFFSGPLFPCESIEIYITAHVEGPYCSIDFNHALAEGECEHGEFVADEDYAYVHPKKWNVKEVNSPFLQFLQIHPNLFLLLQRLLQRLGL